MAAIRADVPAARTLVDRAGFARMRQFARPDRPHRASSRARTCWSGRSTSRPTASRRPRTSPRPSRRLCGHVPIERLLSMHQLRDGAARPRGRPRQAPGACGGRGAGSGQRLSGSPAPRPSALAWGGSGSDAPKTTPFRPQKTTSIWPSRRVSSAKCFSFKAVSTPLYDRFASFHRRSFLEIETLAGSVPISFVRGEILKWQLEL